MQTRESGMLNKAEGPLKIKPKQLPRQQRMMVTRRSINVGMCGPITLKGMEKAGTMQKKWPIYTVLRLNPVLSLSAKIGSRKHNWK